MPSGRKALGKGLAALIPTPQYTNHGDDYFMCEIERLIADPDQPRRHFEDEALNDLVQSIKEKGVIQPILVRAHGDDFILIAGERRLRASRRAGLAKIPVIVKEAASTEAFELALIENIQRQDLNALEEAQAYQHLLSTHDIPQQALAHRLGKSRATIANALRLLKLEPELQKFVLDGQLSAGHARCLLAISDPMHRKDLAQRIIDDNLSVRAAEQAVHELQQSPTRPKRRPRRSSPLQPYFEHVATELQDAFGSPVEIAGRGRKGRITIHFNGVDDLRTLRDRLVSALNECDDGTQDANTPETGDKPVIP